MDDEKLVSQAYQHLLDTYLSSRHRRKVDIIERAFNFAKQAHKGVRRLSGEPYIMHPIAVAQIACEEIGLGSTSICAALLHDVVEDTDYTVEDISNIFGPKVAQIVDGVTKISGGIFGNKASTQAETFKKLLITMSDDIRVILIKISDRLHNMRTLDSQRPSKQYKIAGETLYLYAPLAHRLGLNKIKEELEDLSFRYEHADMRQDIINKLEASHSERLDLFDEFTAPIRAQLDQLGLKYRIQARIKTPYSIFKKMHDKHLPFEEIYDILAARIVFEPQNIEDEITDCFRIYAAAIKVYRPHPDRFRDWLAHPKANGYQALHTTLMSHRGQWIEVQIRSQRMDEIAEQGFAAHWKYKDHGTPGDQTSKDDDDNIESEKELDHWLSTIKEILDDPQPNAIDFLDTIKLGLYAQEIFVVTPKGDFRTMPAESTVLDFAFSLHTFIGSHCIGAKVNHVLVPLSHKLQSGDQIEILTSKNAHIEKEWMQWANTAKAKSKIQAALRREEREWQKKGEQIVTDFLAGYDLKPDSANLDRLCILHGIEMREDLMAAIGDGRVVLTDDDVNVLRQGDGQSRNWKKYFKIFRGKNSDSQLTNTDGGLQQQNDGATALVIDKKKPFILNDERLPQVTLASCCRPIPGDPVMGYLDQQGKLFIHKRVCPVGTKLKASDGNSIVEVRWDLHQHRHFPATLAISGIDRQGILGEMATILSGQLDVNIKKLHVESDDGIFACQVMLEVHNADNVTQICNVLRQVRGIQSVNRTS